MPDLSLRPNLVPLHAWLIEAGTSDVAAERLFDGFCARLFFVNDPATTEIYTLSLHDALPISRRAPPAPRPSRPDPCGTSAAAYRPPPRSEEHTSELQSRRDLVCRLLLEKKKKKQIHLLGQKKKKKKME